MSNYRSQWKQDEFVHKFLFPNTRNGFFVDVGAHDGITGSNSFFFEKELGWSGICIEPILERYVELVKNRDCYCLNACVYNEVKRLSFTQNVGYTEMLSGITDAYDSRHVSRIEREQKTEGGQSIECKKSAYTLNGILALHGVQGIDYLSIDTEGSEYNVLLGLDFNKYLVKVISVENNYPDDFLKIDALLKANNFSHVATLAGDEMYVNNTVFKVNTQGS